MSSEPVSKDAIRAKIFKGRDVKKEIVTFFDAEIELRQPTLGDILEAQADPDRTRAIIMQLVRYAYVPGTNERVFEDTDVDSLRAQPFGSDFVRASEALARLTEVNFLEQKPA